jgi:hypothetical protein
MSWLSYLDPLNWPSDLSNTFVNQLENGLLYILALVLNSFLIVSNSMVSLLINTFESILGAIISSAESVGPFGLPIFVIGTTVLIGTAFLAFSVAKDVPVVGSFV